MIFCVLPVPQHYDANRPLSYFLSFTDLAKLLGLFVIHFIAQYVMKSSERIILPIFFFTILHRRTICMCVGAVYFLASKNL
jgi:hypothetical protein